MTAILWAGGEDVDFQSGGTVNVNTAGSSRYRTSYARCAICSNSTSNAIRSSSFEGGAITSAWLHAQVCMSTAITSAIFCGLGLNSAGNAGVFLGADSSNSLKLALWKWDGTTFTKLATESAASMNTGAPFQVDVNIASYGASATVTGYIGGVQVFSYSGSTAISGVSNLDCVAVIGNSSNNVLVSEIIVADGDTRALSALTAAPNAAGDSAGSWTNTYTSINPVSIADANAIYNNATGSTFLCNLTDLPSGSFSVLAVKAIMRAEITAGATPASIKLGIKSGGTTDLDAGHSPGAAWTQYERLMNATNPATGAAWATADINPLQLAFQAA